MWIFDVDEKITMWTCQIVDFKKVMSTVNE